MTTHLRRQLRDIGVDAGTVDRRLMELRMLGLPYPTIAKVVGYYEGWFLTEDQVRGRLLALGAPKNERKARWLRGRGGVLVGAAPGHGKRRRDDG